MDSDETSQALEEARRACKAALPPGCLPRLVRIPTSADYKACLASRSGPWVAGVRLVFRLSVPLVSNMTIGLALIDEENLATASPIIEIPLLAAGASTSASLIRLFAAIFAKSHNRLSEDCS